MQVKDLVAAMEAIAPTRYAEGWDNVGLLVGDPAREVKRVLVTIDYTCAVAEEGKRMGCEAVVAYHPPIFGGMKRIAAGSVVEDAARRGVAIYSPHTAWDAAEGGANDVLVEMLGLMDVRALKPVEEKAREYKLVVFVPGNEVGKVSEAMFAAGAGIIGHYSHCSFELEGMGTFLGDETTKPTVGTKGRKERVKEVRVETVAPITKLEGILAAMRKAHPYEEPAFDLVRLAAVPEGKGLGRVGDLGTAMMRQKVVERVKKELELDRVLVAGEIKGKATRVAVCPGAGREFLDLALQAQADVYLTGELPHHDALRAADAGMMVICTLHSNSERGSMGALAEKLRKGLPGVKVVVSKVDRDPYLVV